MNNDDNSWWLFNILLHQCMSFSKYRIQSMEHPSCLGRKNLGGHLQGRERDYMSGSGLNRSGLYIFFLISHNKYTIITTINNVPAVEH